MQINTTQQSIAEFQLAGQDIPWMLKHWAELKANHAFLIWEPKTGEHKTYK